MHTVDVLDQALDLAGQLGYLIRYEWLGGSGGGGCELNEQKVLFLDLALGPDDQLDRVLDTLRLSPEIVTLPMSDQLRHLLGVRKIA